MPRLQARADNGVFLSDKGPQVQGIVGTFNQPAVVRPPHAKGNASTARALRVLKTGSPLAFPETLIHVCFLVKDKL